MDECGTLLVWYYAAMKKRPLKKGMTLDRLAELVVEEFSRRDARFDRIDERLASMEGELRTIRQDINAILKRLDRLEEDVRDIRGYAKEIDALRAEVRTLQTRLSHLEAVRGTKPVLN